LNVDEDISVITKYRHLARIELNEHDGRFDAHRHRQS
jgi:hypothetical protein